MAFVLVGILLLTKGGDFLTDGASDLACGLGIHPAVIGLTVVSISTSAPELFTSLAAITGDAKRLIIGNLVGSNLANVGLVLGITALVRPIAGRGVPVQFVVITPTINPAHPRKLEITFLPS